MTHAEWWRCPNQPTCPHPGLLHDIHELDDPRPVCCADGCECGKNTEPTSKEQQP